MDRLKKNDLRVINTIFSQHRPTRSSIVKGSRLSLVKVSAIVRDLVARGYIRHTGKKRGSGGRPSRVYQLGPACGSAIGISLSPDMIRIVAVDPAKQLTGDRTFSLDLPEQAEKRGEVIFQQVSAAVQDCLTQGLARPPVVAIGLALPGVVDTLRGLWLRGLQSSSVTHVHLAQLLEERFGVPVFPEDIARALAYREMLVGQGRGMRDFVLLHFGLGMGAGVVVGRRLLTGHHGVAGDIGHVRYPGSDRRCNCGNVGCFETVVSVPGVLRTFRDRLAEGVVSSLQGSAPGPDGNLSFPVILEAADAGDRFTLATLKEVGQVLGHACSILLKLCNPHRLIVSGEGAMLSRYLEPGMNGVITAEVLPETLKGCRTPFVPFDPRDGALGAGLLALARRVRRQIRGHGPAARAAG